MHANRSLKFLRSNARAKWPAAFPALVLAASMVTPASAAALPSPGESAVGAAVQAVSAARYAQDGDIFFNAPSGPGWSAVPTSTDVSEVLDLGLLPGEQVLAAWRAPDMSPPGSYPERPYVYLYATAVPLGNDTAIQDAGDLAAKKLAAYGQNSTVFDVAPATSGLAGGVATQTTYVREGHRFSEPKSVDGIAADFAGGGEATTSAIEFRSQLVSLVKGNWGYTFQLISTQPKALSDRMDDLAGLLNSLKFGSSIVPAAAVATGAAAAAPAASATGGALDRVPQWGSAGDVSFNVPSEEGWILSPSVAGLKDLMPSGTLRGEHTLGQWRTLANPGGPYVYLQAQAVDLSAHPEVKSVDDLINLKQRALDLDSDGMQTGARQNVTAGGVPARIVDSTQRREFDGQVALTDVAAAVRSDQTVDHLTWNTRDAYLIKGNWGYIFRLASIDAESLRNQYGDLEAVLEGLKFNY